MRGDLCSVYNNCIGSEMFFFLVLGNCFMYDVIIEFNILVIWFIVIF